MAYSLSIVNHTMQCAGHFVYAAVYTDLAFHSSDFFKIKCTNAERENGEQSKYLLQNFSKESMISEGFCGVIDT